MSTEPIHIDWRDLEQLTHDLNRLTDSGQSLRALLHGLDDRVAAVQADQQRIRDIYDGIEADIRLDLESDGRLDGDYDLDPDQVEPDYDRDYDRDLGDPGREPDL